jgi:hypothetical protein
MIMAVVALQPEPELKSNSTLHRVVRNRPARLLAYCCSVARVIACSVTVARKIALPNKIPVARPEVSGVDDELRPWGRSKLKAVNRRL